MPSRVPSTTCPSPLHFTASPICRLGRGRKTNLLPDPGYLALTNICLEDGGCQDLPGHSSKNHVKIPSKICRRNLLLRCSPVSISTLKKRLILLCSSEFSGVQCATLEVAYKDTKEYGAECTLV